MALGADELGPVRPRIGIATEIPRYGPWPGQGMVDHRDLVMQQVLLRLVEIQALLEDRLVVVVQRQPGGIVMTRSLEGSTGFDLERVVMAVMGAIDPVPDRVAGERRLDLGRPFTP